jgi:hypothetical protein
LSDRSFSKRCGRTDGIQFLKTGLGVVAPTHYDPLRKMRNGEYPADKETIAHLRKLQKLVMELAERLNLVEQAVMMLFGSVTDLSNRTGAQKSAFNKKVLRSVLQLHRSSWKKRRKQLSKYL